MSHTLIFDIETVGESWSDLDDTTKHSLTRWIDRAITEPEAHEAALRDIREGLGFSPLTGRIVAIGLYDLERARGVVYYESNGEEVEDGDFIYKPRTEKEMLEDFWDGAMEYDTFVTFNGRGFDVPFLNLRTAIHGLQPTHNLMDGRYLYQQKYARHVDLQDQLTFYGAMHRKPPLHLFCRAFGIKSPKTDGVAGDDVALLAQEGRFIDIARYNAGDVVATTELYKRWLDTLAPQSFKETNDEC